MASEFYKRSQQDSVGVQQTAVAGPDLREAAQGNERRAKSIVDGLDSLVSMGAGFKKAGDIYAEGKTKEAIAKGQTAAMKGEARPESEDFWSGDAQQKAYDNVRSENEVADLPDYVNQHMANNKEIKKPLDEMSRDERQSWVNKARADFFKERKINEAPYKLEAEQHANVLISKQLDMLDKEAVSLRDSKAQANVSSLVSKTVDAFSGEPADIDAVIEADLTKYKQSLGDSGGEKTNGAIVTGLLQSVMTERPNLKTLGYLQSEEAKKRFGHMQGFDRAVKQAQDHSLTAQNAEIVKLKAAAENEFYGLLNVGGFSTKEEVQDQLNNYPDTVLDQGDKYSLMNKALKHMKTSAAADTLQGAIATKNFGVVNSASQEDLLASYERNVMPKSADVDAILNADEDPSSPAMASQNAFTKWVKEGYNVPNHVKQHLNSPINAGNTNAWDRRLATYQRMSQRLGATGVAKLYETDTQASLDEYASLTADVVMKPEDKKQALTNFIEGAKQDRISGLSTNATIRKEMMDEDKGIMGDLQKFAAEGGGDTTMDFSVPTDLQPFTTIRSNSDTAVSGYAVKSLAGNYSIYRRQNPNAEPEVALRKAKNDFLNQNIWVDWSDKSTYVPREFGDNFAKRGMDYVRDSGVITKLSISEGLPPEVIERKVTIEPSSDYHSSRKMSIYYDGIEQSHQFNLQQFDKKTGMLSAQERMKIERQNSDLRNSPEYKAKQDKLMKFQKSLGTFGFMPN